MNRATKAAAAAAAGLFLLAHCPAFPQKSKPAPDPVQREISRFLKNAKDAKTLHSGDTLRVGQIPGAKGIRLITFSERGTAVSGNGKRLIVVGCSDGPGYYSGQLQYRQNGRFFTGQVSVYFAPKAAPPIYGFSHICKDFEEVGAPEKTGPLKTAPSQGRPGRYRPHPVHLRDFFGWPMLEDTRAYGGAIVSVDGYGVPNIGLNWDARAARIGKHGAFRYAITATCGAKKFHISGIGGGSMSDYGAGSTIYLDASARAVETYISMGIEFGSGHLSLAVSPLLGVGTSFGKCLITTYRASSSGKVLPLTVSDEYGRWRIFSGANASFSMNFDIAKLVVFGNFKGAFSVEGYPVVPDRNETCIWSYGVILQVPLLQSPKR
ncbi:MAG: hypothetical protein WC263_04250, partial [Candidatus Micrarchaeia archaeon]|jgi:hypothetical protein